MAAPARQLHLNAFLRNIGQHEAAWRLPETRIAAITDIDHYVELARIAERGKLDAVFFADHPVLKGKTEFRPFDALDPFTLVTGLSGVASQVGLVASAQRGSAVVTDLGLPGQDQAWPYELSGEQQRVAMARSVVRNPGLVLDDKPFGARADPDPDAPPAARSVHQVPARCPARHPRRRRGGGAGRSGAGARRRTIPGRPVAGVTDDGERTYRNRQFVAHREALLAALGVVTE